jgi:hypothetical protein
MVINQGDDSLNDMPRVTGTAKAKTTQEEDVVRRFFTLIESKNLDELLNLFDYDAVVSEPFSRAENLRGRYEIEPFLKVALMANADLRREIKIEKPADGHKNQLSALVTFEKGGKVRGRFAFELDPESRKIRKLKIQFL